MRKDINKLSLKPGKRAMSEPRSGLDVGARSRVFAVICVSFVGWVITQVSEQKRTNA